MLAFRPGTLLKKRLQQRCFPFNIAKFLKIAFFLWNTVVAAFVLL